MGAAVEYAPVPDHLEELEKIFVAHQNRVFRAAYRITGNPSDAEDVLQTVFLRLVRSGTESVDKMESYLHRAAVNAALDLLRARRVQVPIDDVEHNLAGPDSTAELREQLRRAVADLHPTAAEMFALRYFEGYENSEIAGIMDTTAGVVAVTLHRARTRLQDQLRTSLGEL